jgi:hypothetical protein
MFEQLLQVNYEGGIQYPVQRRIDLALNYSNHHNLVVAAANMVQREYGAALSRENLFELWRNEEYSLGIKYLSTLWWGNKTRHASVAYSNDNICTLNRIQVDLSAVLNQIAASNNFNEALDLLSELFYEMEPHRNHRGGNFYLKQIGSAFFTKVLQYYFASHPLESNPAFLPIICDQWLCKAVYIEMTENDQIVQRDAIFTNPITFRCHNDSCSDSYIAFINYFNARVGQLTAVYPDLTSFEMEGRIFSIVGRNYIQNFFGGFDMQDNEDAVPDSSSPIDLSNNISDKPLQDQRGQLFILIKPETVKRREVDFGYEFRVEGIDYYLFIGHRNSFHYCELLTKSPSQPISTFSRLQILRDNGFNKEGFDYIYKKLRNPYDETQASNYLEFIKDLLV